MSTACIRRGGTNKLICWYCNKQVHDRESSMVLKAVWLKGVIFVWGGIFQVKYTYFRRLQQLSWLINAEELLLHSMGYGTNVHACICITCSWGGIGPGFMLLADEYNFGMCLSRLQRRHSFDLEWKWRPGNLSEQVEHVGVSNVAMFAWNFRILAWMEHCWNNGSCGCTDCCSMYRVL